MLSGVLLVVAALLAGCAGAGSSGGPAARTDDEAISEPGISGTASPSGGIPLLRVVLTNDDGIDAPGLAALARAISDLWATRVYVVAPSEDRSGTGSSTTTGKVTVTRVDKDRRWTAFSVDGYPADTVRVALDELSIDPHLVVSGVNRGSNAGSAVPISGTVGAARAAISRGVPAIAASAASGYGTPEYGPAVRSVTRWIAEHRDELLAGTVTTRTLVNVNAPFCPSGSVRGEREVTVAKGDVRPARINDCRSPVRDPDTDVEAVDAGFVAVTRVPAELATPYPR